MYIKKDFGDIKNSTNKSNFDLPMHAPILSITVRHETYTCI